MGLSHQTRNVIAGLTRNRVPEAHHPDTKMQGGTSKGRGKRKIGFTLAEVLITLGIIGIVAAMTMPTLIQKHRKQVVETHLKRFYSNMNQAIRLSEVDNGDKKYWDFTNNVCIADTHSEECLMSFYNKYLKPYLKVTDVQYKITSWGKGNLFLYFPDGSAVRLAYLGKDMCYVINAKDLDTKEVLGQNSFLFGFYPRGAGDVSRKRHKYFLDKGVEPYLTDSWDGTIEGLKRDSGMFAKLIQLNGWRVPDDYPLKF